MGKGLIFLPMETNTQENTKMENLMDKVSTFGQMVVLTKVDLKMG